MTLDFEQLIARFYLVQELLVRSPVSYSLFDICLDRRGGHVVV